MSQSIQKMKYSTTKSSGDITFIRFHGRFGTRGHAHFVCDVFWKHTSHTWHHAKNEIFYFKKQRRYYIYSFSWSFWHQRSRPFCLRCILKTHFPYLTPCNILKTFHQVHDWHEFPARYMYFYVSLFACLKYDVIKLVCINRFSYIINYKFLPVHFLLKQPAKVNGMPCIMLLKFVSLALLHCRAR